MSKNGMSRRNWFARAFAAVVAAKAKPATQPEPVMEPEPESRGIVVVMTDPFAKDSARSRQEEAMRILRKAFGGYN